jgi:hypothetical protein
MIHGDKKMILDDLLNQKYITLSDNEILNVLMENEDLRILQSKDTFNWYENTGKTEHILSMKTSKNLTYFDEHLDLFLVDREKLKETNNSYAVSTDLIMQPFSKRNSIPDLDELNLSLLEDNSEVNLKDYSLIKSERYLEYPNPNEERVNLNKTVLARLFNKKENKGRTIVYRRTIYRNKIVGSRIYSLENGALKILDKAKNQRLMDFMGAIDYWHDNKLKEGSTKLEKFGTGFNVPSYFSLYS